MGYNPGLIGIYFMAVNSAILLFLLFFLWTLISRGRRGEIPQPLSSPSWLWRWLNFAYPAFLDRLSFRQICLGFAWALGGAAVVWTTLAAVFLMIMAKPHG